MYLKLKMKECNYFSAIKVRIYPSDIQKKIIDKNAHTSRWYYPKYMTQIHD